MCQESQGARVLKYDYGDYNDDAMRQSFEPGTMPTIYS
jgi:hypothetical protein